MDNIEIKVPIIDKEAINKKAEEFANEAIIAEIREFYTAWNSPYRKKVKEYLEEQSIGFSFSLPKIVAQLNKGLSAEVDKIVNESIANSYIPVISKVVGNVEKNIKLSDILKELIETSMSYSYSDFNATIEKHPEHDWYIVELADGDNSYNLTLHDVSYRQDSKEGSYQLLSLPYVKQGSFDREMELKAKDATLKMPFVANILENRFMAYLANLVLFGSNIEIDVDGFEDDMFDSNHY